MADLIDRDALLEVFGFTPHECDDCRGCPYRRNKCLIREFSPADICGIINDAPTVDHVKHGRWLNADDKESAHVVKEDGSIFVEESSWCSECHCWLDASDEFDIRGNYCPNCGAQMNQSKKSTGCDGAMMTKDVSMEVSMEDGKEGDSNGQD